MLPGFLVFFISLTALATPQNPEVIPRPLFLPRPCAEVTYQALIDSLIVRRSQDNLTLEQVKWLRHMQVRTMELILSPLARAQKLSFQERSEALEVRIELARWQPVVIDFQRIVAAVTDLDNLLLKSVNRDEVAPRPVALMRLQQQIVEVAIEVREKLEALEQSADSAFSHVEGVRILNDRFAVSRLSMITVAESLGISFNELNELSLGNSRILSCSLAADLAGVLEVDPEPFTEAWGLTVCSGDADRLDRLIRQKRWSNQMLGGKLGISGDAVAKMRVSGSEQPYQKHYFERAFLLLEK